MARDRQKTLLVMLTTSWLAVGCNREPLDVAPAVDLDRFQGQWHEIAHLPRIAQQECSGTIATYSRDGADKLTLVHECTLPDGRYHGATLHAKVRDPAAPAKMEVDFGGHLGDYWILETGPDYRYAVIGHPSRDYLWVLSRTPEMNPADLDGALQHARDKGFDTNRLEYTPAGPVPTGTPAPAASYGCALAIRQPDGLVASLGGVLVGALALVLRRRRRATV